MYRVVYAYWQQHYFHVRCPLTTDWDRL